MLKWIPYVMVRVAFFFVGGILIGINAPDFIHERLASALFWTLLISYAVFYKILKPTAWLGPVSGVLGLTAIVLAGYLMVLSKTEKRNPNHFSHLQKPIESFIARAISSPEEKARSFKMEVELLKVRSNDHWQTVNGKCLIYIQKKQAPPTIRYGDEIFVDGSPQRVPGPANPGEFDLRKFLSYKNISHQLFVAPEKIKMLAASRDHSLITYSHKARSWAAAKIKKHVAGTQEQAITMALVLGVAEGLDNDLQDAYAASGAMHVLSVSGLHVGIIYALILLFFKPVSGFAWSRWPIALLSLACLWAYAFVTGLSPSVLRAVMMFSFMVVAKPFGHNTNIYNTLAASAFLLLIYDPFLVMSVGFQLSYLAVIGIVYLQKPLYELWEPASVVWDKLWQITCVSLAAQAATFALGIFYFHQFPVYFLISNMLVIPLSTAVLVAGIVLLVVSPWTLAVSLVATVLQFLVRLLNGSVFFIERLPASVIQGIQINGMQCLLLLGITVSMILIFRQRKFSFVVWTTVMTAAFSMLQWRNFTGTIKQDRFIVYDIPGHSGLEFLHHGRSYFFSDTVLRKDERSQRFHITPNRMLQGISKLNDASPLFFRKFKDLNVFVWPGHRVLWIDHPNSQLPENLETEDLIIGCNSVTSLAALRKVKFTQLILDSSNSKAYAKRMSAEARENNIPVYDVASRGAYMINI